MAAVATSVPAEPSRLASVKEQVLAATYALGALLLAGEAAVHIQQFATGYHAIRWIGPLFVANAVACVVVIAGLGYSRTRPLAALAGVAVSAIALASLAISYGQGLFGWQEFGFPTAIALAVIAEGAAVIVLSAALALTIALPETKQASGAR